MHNNNNYHNNNIDSKKQREIQRATIENTHTYKNDIGCFRCTVLLIGPPQRGGAAIHFTCRLDVRMLVAGGHNCESWRRRGELLVPGPATQPRASQPVLNSLSTSPLRLNTMQ